MRDLIPARSVAEDMLSRTGNALRDDDFGAYCACFILPQIVETYESQICIETPADLRAVFDKVRIGIAKSGATDVVRHVIQAQYRDPRTIGTTHETRLLMRGHLIRPATPVYCELRLTKAGWKIANGSYAVPDKEQQGYHLSGDVLRARHSVDPAPS